MHRWSAAGVRARVDPAATPTLALPAAQRLPPPRAGDAALPAASSVPDLRAAATQGSRGQVLWREDMATSLKPRKPKIREDADDSQAELTESEAESPANAAPSRTFRIFGRSKSVATFKRVCQATCHDEWLTRDLPPTINLVYGSVYEMPSGGLETFTMRVDGSDSRIDALVQSFRATQQVGCMRLREGGTLYLIGMDDELIFMRTPRSSSPRQSTPPVRIELLGPLVQQAEGSAMPQESPPAVSPPAFAPTPLPSEAGQAALKRARSLKTDGGAGSTSPTPTFQADALSRARGARRTPPTGDGASLHRPTLAAAGSPPTMLSPRGTGHILASSSSSPRAGSSRSPRGSRSDDVSTAERKYIHL